MTSEQIARKIERIVLDLRDVIDEVRDFDTKKSLKDYTELIESIYIPWQE